MGTYNNIHIGFLISNEIKKQNINTKKILLHFNCSHARIKSMLLREYIDTEDLLKWCTLLRVDFFRLYSGYLMLHRGISSKPSIKNNLTEIKIRKNVYTYEIKKFIVDIIRNKELSTPEVIKKYNIPKTTVYKWLHQI